MTRGRATGAAVLALGVALAGCSGSGGGPQAAESATTSPAASPTPTASASSSAASSATSSASSSTLPSTFSPGTASPSATTVQVTCTTVTVTGLGQTTVGPLRTTEIVTVVSDGRNLTPGTSQQTDFVTPVLTAPGGGTITDAGTVQQVANLLVGQKRTVLLTRPAAPDQNVDTSKRPYNTPGTYALYNASGLVSTQAVVQCGGQQQTWTFTAEGEPTTGQVNCAVEPSRSNSLARAVFAQVC